MKKLLTPATRLFALSMSITALILSLTIEAIAQRPATEEDYYRMVTMPIPEDIKLEVGGLAPLPDGRLAVCTRRGEVWIIGNPYMQGSRVPTFKKFASGLHEPLGLMWHPKGYFLCTQRGEVTKLVDNDGDGVADEYRSFYKWPLSGNYHEYSYGPVLLPDGDMIITLNLGWIGYGASLAKWRGWMLKLTEDGKMTPWATGLRSPAGFGILHDGSIFYTENQGDWVGSGRMTHLDKGDFAGNPAGLRWTGEPDSPLALKPGDVSSNDKPMFEVAKTVKNLKVPAVWFPHTLMGISTSDFKEDTTKGAFGPFAGQVFVGDQGHSKIMRVALEKVNGEWQGACFPFREGFQSGIIRTVWGQDGSMFVGMTSRGWAATGRDPYGIQRLVWTGKTPFEMKTITSKPDGFDVAFTLPVDRKTAENPDSYSLNSFTYMYHRTYGSPIINIRPVPIRGVVVAPDGMSVRIVADTVLREGYIHEVKAEGVRATTGNLPVLHPVGYYTLNAIAPGEKLTLPARAVAMAKHEHSTMVAEEKKEMATTKRNVKAVNAKRMVTMPADWTNGPEQTLTLGTKPGLKFDVDQLEVKAGSRIKLVFNNNDDMLHNVVITKPGMGNPVGEAALKLNLNGPKMNYVPNSPNVLYHTNILQPETAESIYFTAPTEPGDYDFICSFPGHYLVMRGTLKVVK